MLVGLICFAPLQKPAIEAGASILDLRKTALHNQSVIDIPPTGRIVGYDVKGVTQIKQGGEYMAAQTRRYRWGVVFAMSCFLERLCDPTEPS